MRLLDAAALGLAAAASPGPFQALLLERAARRGVRPALPLSLVPLASDPPVVLACLLALAGMPPLLLRGLGAAGGLMLLWMAGGVLRGLRAAPPSEDAVQVAPPSTAAGAGFGRAALVNLLNPNAWMFWSLIGGPLLTQALRESPAQGALFLVGFYVPLTATNAALVTAFGLLGGLGEGVRRGLAAFSGVAFLALGLLQLWRALAGG